MRGHLLLASLLVAAAASEDDLWEGPSKIDRPWATVAGCAEIVKRFDFNANYSVFLFKRFHACLEHRRGLKDWRSKNRPSIIAGEHYPVAITPSTRAPPGYWVHPPWDYVVSNFVRRDGTFEVAELSLFGKLAKRGDTICDIGAHIGSYTVPLAAAIGAEGTVHSFEPFRLVFQLLMANVAVNGLSNVHGHQMALGELEETRRVRSPSLTKSSNIGATRIFNQVEEHYSDAHVLQYDGEEDVKVSVLDAFDFPRLDFVKIDVEGVVVEVLRGALGTLRRHRPLLALEFLDGVMPDILRDLEYRCVEKLPVHELWVCVPSERWWRYRWLHPPEGRAMVEALEHREEEHSARRPAGAKTRAGAVLGPS